MKFKRIRMSQELIIDILRQYNDKFPQDMVICGAKSKKLGSIDILLFSHEFPSLPEGEIGELLDVTMEDLVEC